jgi:hypothetical protein
MIQDLLLHFGFDPSNLSYEAVVSRLTDLVLAHINTPNILALIGAVLYVATLMMRTIVPLRIVAIISILFFIAYGALAGVVTTFLLYLLSLPINVYRLRQMLNLVKKARLAALGDDLSMDWLKPFMKPHKYRRGDILFRKGELASEMLYIVTGTFLVHEIGVRRAAGEMIGELGFLSENNRRTQTVECIDGGSVLAIAYEKLLELYFQNPEFGYYFLHLINGRLVQNIERLESMIAQSTAATTNNPSV